MFPTRMTPLTNSILSVERLGPMDAPAIHSSTAAFSSNSSSSSVSSHSQSRSSHTAKGNVSEATGDLTNQTLIRGLQGSHVSPLAQLEHHLRTE